MSDCIKKITASLSYGCDTSHPAKSGLDGGRVVIINKSDIDVSALTMSGNVITNLTLVSGATAFQIGHIKQLGSTASEFAVNDSLDTYTHTFNGRVYTSSASDIERIKELSDGEFIVISETKWKGTNNAAAFKVYGIDNGLKMVEGTYSSLENDGSFVFSLASVEGFGESYLHNIYLETNYATTKAKIDSLFTA